MTEQVNMAALREALNQLRDWALLDINENAIRSDEPNYKKLVDGIIEITNAALSEPPRNCDVSTVEEQMRQKREYCKKTQCSGCPANKGGTISTDRCDFTWAQMPFDSAGKCEDAQ